MKDLSLSFIQSSIHWEDKSANLDHLGSLIDRILIPTDIILLPEMFSTGFSMHAPALAESMDGNTILWMLAKAKAKNALVIGSLIIKANENYFNRLVVAGPQGVIGHYDKRHTFSMADEDQTYTRGAQALIFEWKGWKIRPFVCYDLRFPVWARNRYSDTTGWDYDLAVYVANWPASRARAWKSLALARAIENQCYVATLNRVGIDDLGLEYQGDSQLINSYGEVLLHLGNEEIIQTKVLDKSLLTDHRKIFPVGRDADGFEIR